MDDRKSNRYYCEACFWMDKYSLQIEWSNEHLTYEVSLEEIFSNSWSKPICPQPFSDELTMN